MVVQVAFYICLLLQSKHSRDILGTGYIKIGTGKNTMERLWIAVTLYCTYTFVLILF